MYLGSHTSTLLLAKRVTSLSGLHKVPPEMCSEAASLLMWQACIFYASYTGFPGLTVINPKEKQLLRWVQTIAEKCFTADYTADSSLQVCSWSVLPSNAGRTRLVVCICKCARPVSQCWWSWKATKIARLPCNVKAISSQRFYTVPICVE